MKPLIRRISRVLAALAALLSPLALHAQNYVPLQGIGAVQFADNNGKPLSSGVLYAYQAGTTTPAATYTDYTGTVVNANPVIFNAGGRGTVWLAAGSYYKFILCAQNDGSACASGDILFSVDQVPAISSGGSSGGSPFTGIFISGSANPASAGILRLATGDQICWRNAAGTTNLCISKDGNDILGWSGGAVELPGIGNPFCTPNNNVFWASNANDRLQFCSNGGTPQQYVGSGVDINTSDQVTQLHFGTTAAPLGSSLSNYQHLLWNGTNVVGVSGNTWAGTSGGSANAQTLTLSPALGSYVVGQQFTFQAGFTNTAAATLNINGVGATAIDANSATGLSGLTGGEIIVGNVYTVTYNGAAFVLTGLKPSVVPKKGSNAGDYSTASTSLTAVDGTNLSYTVTIPTGWKLDITASGTYTYGSGGSSGNLALVDGVTVLENLDLTTSAGGAPSHWSFALNSVIAGDGASHTIQLQFSTAGGSAANLTINNSSGIFPVITFRLTPST